ncbi:hypothetical protein C8Q74DRAFT_1441849 [Fomes fomentarius]|nr:hypothetical protein C8Q74DRAFT_1441849 [Fomes fomentarius]
MGFVKIYREANAQLSMSFLTAANSQTIDVGVVEKLKTGLMKASPSKTKSIESLFQARWSPDNKKSFTVSIHAEAALMGAVYSHQTGTRVASTIRIGVSKKCRFCCGMLSVELKNWRNVKVNGSGGPDDTDYPLLVLPEGHSKVFPWMPRRGACILSLPKLLQCSQNITTATS